MTTPYYSETYRPQVHFSPEVGWMNDPNGLVYFEGEYHLFFQYHPHGTRWSTMHWGHAVSTDMIHWQHLPIALYPDDIGPIFSGSVVADLKNTSGLVPGGGLIAVYSYQNQSQGIAYSRDGGRTWEKYAGNPVIPSPEKDFRDPKVFWHTPTGRWVMALAAGDRVNIYTSPDLVNWTFASEFGADRGAHGGVWECPDLFPLDLNGHIHWVLIVSVGNGAIAGGSGTQYFIGQFDGTKFVSDNPPDQALWLDYGPDNYALVTWENVPGSRRVGIGWMNNWHYGNDIPTSTWRGATTLPREFSLRKVPQEGIRLVQRPIPELSKLRGKTQHWGAETIHSARNLLPSLEGTPIELDAEFELGTAREFGLRIGPNVEDAITISYDTATARVSVDRRVGGDTTFSGIFARVSAAPLHVEDGRIRLRIYLDMSSIEVFGITGESDESYSVITSQVFPDLERSGLSLYVLKGEVKLLALTVYHLHRIWS